MNVFVVAAAAVVTVVVGGGEGLERCRGLMIKTLSEPLLSSIIIISKYKTIKDKTIMK